MNKNIEQIATGRPILSLSSFSKKAGISNTTAWRWRKQGWLKVINIAGRPYLTDDSLTDFMERAKRGEFAQEPKGAAAKAP